MAREFPRFLYSNPQNTKSKGPFVVHTLAPFAIAKINGSSNSFSVIIVSIDNNDSLIKENLEKDIYNWLLAQIKAKELSF